MQIHNETTTPQTLIRLCLCVSPSVPHEQFLQCYRDSVISGFFGTGVFTAIVSIRKPRPGHRAHAAGSGSVGLRAGLVSVDVQFETKSEQLSATSGDCFAISVPWQGGPQIDAGGKGDWKLTNLKAVALSLAAGVAKDSIRTTYASEGT